ncbi:GtrA family protein [Alicyclobacillus pomorum]|uniref:GtrA family protein n=1 Tax=Alicyclobacillus pomorum TaxID=204470 RepID=UPI000422E0F7|nr:GtrA family protein [Alicyclobacillus pomorum]
MPSNLTRLQEWPRASWKRYVKFLVVGGMNAVVDLFVLNVLLFLSTPKTALELTLCNSIAVACAIANSYLWNRRWTFKDATDGSLRQRCLFLLQALVNIAINDAVVILFTRELDSMNFASPVVESNVAKAAAMLVSSSVSYWFMSVLVFRLRPARPR